MPPTPLHFLAVLPLYFKWPDTFDANALLVSSTFIDFEILYLMVLGRPTVHGIWHSYLFALTIYPAVLSAIVYITEHRFEKTLFRIYHFLRIYPKKVKYSFKLVYLSCLVGGVSHIFLDMWVHNVMPYVLWPFYYGNPFYLGKWSFIVFILVGLLSVYAVYLWIKQMPTHK